MAGLLPRLTGDSLISYFSFAAGITVGSVLLSPVADKLEAAISKGN
jgi:patatin-like phospholipase/acyl hydrolase